MFQLARKDGTKSEAQSRKRKRVAIDLCEFKYAATMNEWTNECNFMANIYVWVCLYIGVYFVYLVLRDLRHCWICKCLIFLRGVVIFIQLRLWDNDKMRCTLLWVWLDLLNNFLWTRSYPSSQSQKLKHIWFNYLIMMSNFAVNKINNSVSICLRMIDKYNNIFITLTMNVLENCTNKLSEN